MPKIKVEDFHVSNDKLFALRDALLSDDAAETKRCFDAIVAGYGKHCKKAMSEWLAKVQGDLIDAKRKKGH